MLKYAAASEPQRDDNPPGHEHNPDLGSLATNRSGQNKEADAAASASLA